MADDGTLLTSDPPDPKDMTDLYNTALPPAQEEQFQAWQAESPQQRSTYDYDSRGAWQELQSGDMTADERGHLGDKFKKPNHPTFSDQSMYHGIDGQDGGSWGVDDQGKTTSFTPSATNLKNMSAEDLGKYLAEVEPEVKLNIPHASKTLLQTLAEKLFPGLAK
ncbi:hypothetical protein RGU70_13660 [Herbaspirillum sp. RTI4]|uniref:hypothetical protein n=1 Tax=Herbaspirillum sp. RTI4 TaxID=3048640 RepID=UPI002AB58962|nr:hypothetical protein [Herbaspirillum sp. RTI4]MDY7579360.1 hypothetical protein [Herbaspirillum sp. RTI4]MEA9980274.1 hypothetical protein [Herbaspirillum sp. RTI4]